MCVCSSCFSCIQLFVTLWSVACQAPLSMGFSKQEYWSGLPCLLPGDLPTQGLKLFLFMPPALQAILYPMSHLGSPDMYTYS